jgi:hypothetical protein
MSLIREHRSLIPSTNAEDAAAVGGLFHFMRILKGDAVVVRRAGRLFRRVLIDQLEAAFEKLVLAPFHPPTR